MSNKNINNIKNTTGDKLSDTIIKNRSNFYEFLEKRNFAKQPVEHTHVAFGYPWGKYIIKEEDESEFIDLYSKLVGKIELHMGEKPKKVGPLMIDIDFRYDSAHNTRQYTLDNAKYLISKITKNLRKYIDITTKSPLTAFLFEKDHPTDAINKAGIVTYKDGMHIIYPNVALSDEMRYLIITATKNLIVEENGFGNIPFINTPDDIFDESIIKNNVWMMYGSNKDKSQGYVLTHIFDHKCNEMDKQQYGNCTKDFVSLFSNRKQYNKVNEFHPNADPDEIANIIKDFIIKPKSKPKPKSNKAEIINEEDFDNEEEDEVQIEKNDKSDYGMAVRLTSILSVARAKDYHSWVRVGWALRNISPKLLNCWKKFSRKAGGDYDEDSCIRIWDNARDSGNVLTISSLHMWARTDDIEEYGQILRDSINQLFVDAETGTDKDIADIVHNLYKHTFVCTSINHKNWYEFQDHRWVEVEQGHTLYNKISEDLNKEFVIIHSAYIADLGTKKGINQDEILKKCRNIIAVATKLKKNSFVQSVMIVCERLFYKKNFEEKLDSNPDIIGFNNGVYDLKNGCFRAGLPEDYITFTVGYDYSNDYHVNHPDVQWAESFLKQIQPDKDMNLYLKMLLASYLDGHTAGEKFIIWTGCGCHKKDTKIMMYDYTFKNVQNIKINDVIMGDDKTPRIVSELFRGNDHMYKITSTNNYSYVVNKNHILSLKYMEDNKKWDDNLQCWIMTWYQNTVDENNITINIEEYKKLFDSDRDFNEYIKNINNVVNFGDIIDIKLSYLLKSGIDVTNFHEYSIDIDSRNFTTNNITIEYNGIDNYYGFQIDKNGRYVMENFVVTHNSNGKSKTVEFFQYAFGEYCGTLPVTVITRKRGSSGAATPEMAMTRGQRFVVFQEPESDDQINVGYMKELTGGDWIYARKLFGHPFRFKPQFKLLLACNKLPSIPSNDGGTWRRLRVTPFGSEFVDIDENGKYNGKDLLPHQQPRDYELVSKMKKCNKAFLWLLINIYYPMYKKYNGIQEPLAVMKYTNKYRKASDLYNEFMTDNLAKAADEKTTLTIQEIYSQFKYWYRDSYANGNCPSKNKVQDYFTSTAEYKYKKGKLYGYKFNDAETTTNELDD